MKAPLPMLRAMIAAVALALAIPVPRLAFAQAVSDADRQAARDLFTAGFQLQQAGKYADALDKFQRAQAVFSAPTNLLRIAECEAQLGKLVEASETYRGLARLQLPKDSPPSFVAAQQQGAAELQQVEARIPKVRIDVVPANVPNLSISIDEQPMNVALVGVERPIDPGPHKITAFAPGYGQKDATVVIKEKDPTKQVTLTLQQTGVVVYTPVPGGGAPPNLTPLPPPASGEAPPPPPPAPPPPTFIERPKPPTTGILAGVRLGPDFVTGGLMQGFSMKQAFGTGFALGFQGGLRFARHLYVGAIYEHVFYGQGSGIGNIATNYGANSAEYPTPGSGISPPNITTFGNLIALDLSYISNPEGVGVTIDGAVAYRAAGFSASDSSLAVTYSGEEAIVGMGIWIRAAQSMVIIPRVDAGIGSFSNQSIQCNPSCTTGSGSVSGAQEHFIFFLGVGGYFNLDFGKKH